MAGLEALGIQPLRRTALTIDPPQGMDIEDWPLMIEAEEAFYFKPDAGQILISPADETLTAPCVRSRTIWTWPLAWIDSNAPPASTCVA